MLGMAGQASVAHFNNLKARAEATSAYPQQVEVNGKTVKLRAPRNSVEVTAEVNAGRIPQKLVRPVNVAIKTHVVIDKTPNPKELRPITLVPGRKMEPSDFFIHALAMADIAEGRGFRQPSTKAKNWQSTSLMEQLSIKMGISKPNAWEGSERGNKKRAAQIECNASIVLDRLIAEFPDRAYRARNDEKLARWFEAKVAETLEHFPDQDTIKAMVNNRVRTHPAIPEFKIIPVREARPAVEARIQKYQEAA